MSGLKQGDFNVALDRLLANINNYINLARKASARFVSSARGTESIEGILGRLDSIPAPSATAREFASDECTRLNADIAAARSNIEECSDMRSNIAEVEKEALSSQEDSSKIIAEVNQRIEAIKERAQHKIDTTSWANLALNSEVAAINNLNRDIMSRIKASETAASAKHSQAHDMQSVLMGKLSSISQTCDRLSRRAQEIEGLAEKRHEAYLIKEEQKRTSVQCSDEIKLLSESIEKLDTQRFKPGEYAAILGRIEDFEEEYGKGNFEKCSAIGPAIVESLQTFFEELSDLIQKFSDAEKVAQSHLASAREEVAGIDLADLSRWSQKGKEVQAAVELLEKSAKEIEEISSSGCRASEFDAPRQWISSAIASLRALLEEATNNHARYDARDDIRKAIKDALKALKYDKPEYYFQDKLEDGSPDELSGLTIYAHNPADTGNMRLTVDLDSKVQFEIFREDEQGHELEVTQRDGVACHNAVLEFGRHLESAGIQLNVTDWGKAKDLPQAQEQGRITWDDADPDKKGSRQEKEREQTRVKEQEKERRRQ